MLDLFLKGQLPAAYETMATVASPAINFGRGILGLQNPFTTRTMRDRMAELESQKGTSGTIGYEDYGLPVTKSGGRFTGGLFNLAINNPVDFGLAGSVGRYGFGPEGYTGLKYDFTPDPDTGSTGNALLDFINEGGIKSKLSSLGKTIGDAIIGPAYAPELDDIESIIEARKNREQLNRQGLMALDDAGLNTAATINEFSQTSKPRFDLRNFLTNIKDKGIDMIGSGKNLAFRGIGSLAAGPIGGFVGGILGNLTDQFENRQLYAPVVDEFGNMYSAEDLNKLNALGGYYTDPARSSRRRTARIANLLERQKLGKKFSQKNLNKLLAQKKAEEAAQQAAFNKLNEIRIQRDRDSMSGGVGETLGGTFGSSVNDPGSFSDYS